MTFKDLGLAPTLVQAVTEKGYTKPSPIQQKAIPVVLQGKDVLASAQTGTGKTAGFTLPMLQILSEGKKLHNRPIRALVLTPTRELAAQVQENVLEYSTHLDVKSTVIFGGVKQNPQVAILRKGVDILVATPGRLLDLISQKFISLAKVEILVLDEADRMLDMGFLRDIKKVLASVPRQKQSLLFSATFSKDIKQLAGTFLNNPVLVEAEPENSTAEKVIQKAYRVDAAKKTELTIDLITDGIWQQVLIFTRTKHGANRLSEKLNKNGITAAAIHGNKSQAARTKALAGFKANDIRVLVATDIAARGLDIPLLPHVINFELPNVAEDYVHRIGRTGRAGASGEALSFVSNSEIDYLKDIQKLLGYKLEIKIKKGYEPTENDPYDKPKQGGQRRKFSRPSSGGGNNWRNKKSRKPGSGSGAGGNRKSR